MQYRRAAGSGQDLCSVLHPHAMGSSEGLRRVLLARRYSVNRTLESACSLVLLPASHRRLARHCCTTRLDSTRSNVKVVTGLSSRLRPTAAVRVGSDDHQCNHHRSASRTVDTGPHDACIQRIPRSPHIPIQDCCSVQTSHLCPCQRRAIRKNHIGVRVAWNEIITPSQAAAWRFARERGIYAPGTVIAYCSTAATAEEHMGGCGGRCRPESPDTILQPEATPGI
jgi:hypothetical protein